MAMNSDVTICKICGQSGTKVYEKLNDQLFGILGDWDISQCTDDKCGLAWLSSALPPQGVGEFYRNYYTHGVHQDDVSLNKHSWQMKIAGTALNLINRISGLSNERALAKTMFYLHNEKPGRLLDIGCGDGARLMHFQELGWQVEGQEIDKNAAEIAKSNNPQSTIHFGELENLALSNNAYDAIILNHVLEHTTAPAELLIKCKALLRPRGTLISIQPNFESRGHTKFKRNWRGLEPPRHLYQFSPKNLRRMAERCGMSHAQITTSSAHAEAFAMGSIQTKKHIPMRQVGLLSLPDRLAAVWFQYCSLAVIKWRPNSGEECIFYWNKPE